MKVCAGIVLYHPDYDRLRKNVDAVFPQVEKLIMVNNAPEDIDTLRKIIPENDITWINNDYNRGIAGALNQIIDEAAREGYKWVLTLDQDGVCSDDLADKLCKTAVEYDNAAMIAPLVIENGKVWEDGVHRWKQGEYRGDRNGQCDTEDVPFCITSGTLTSVEAIIDTGGFDEKLFIDEVDRDICIRLRYKGYRIIRVNTAELQHEFGLKLVRRRILFTVYEYRNYSPFRVYYQLRNMVYMIRKYGTDYKPYPIWRLIRPFFTFFIKFLFEPQRFARLSAFFRGYFAGWRMEI